MFLGMDYASKGLHYHKPKLQQDHKLGKTLVHHLKTSISQTLDYFFPLVGHLGTIELDDETSSFSIDYNNTEISPNFVELSKPHALQQWFPNGIEGLVAVIRNRNLDPEEETNFFLEIGAKSRLHQLLEQYTGNVMQGGLITMKIKELQQHGLGKSYSIDNKLARTISNLLVLGGSPQFDYYSIDFRWGKPIVIRSGVGNKHDGKIAVYGGCNNRNFCMIV
ncbi:hypothetical protein CRYUN_Cryun17cG0063100 [Craigia yunnanensis]